jgi:hypothetical protein
MAGTGLDVRRTVYPIDSGFVFPNGSRCDAARGLMPGPSSSLAEAAVSVVGAMDHRPDGRLSFRLTVWLFPAIHWPVIAADRRRT